MDLERLLTEAASYGVAFVRAPGDRLIVRAPARPPRRLRNQLKKYKSEILARLESNATPYIDAAGDLRIPINTPRQYQYWNRGQRLVATLVELGAGDKIIKKHKAV